MAKKILAGAIAGIIIVALVWYGASPPDYGTNLDMERMHGSISTAMGSPIFGDSEAELTIVEFGDYQCHQCYNWFHNTKPALFDEYILTGKANFVFVDMAFLGRDSPIAAQASYCAEDQGLYWEYHNMLYELHESEIDGGWANRDRLKDIAQDMGLDTELFSSCLDSNKYHKRVQYNISEAVAFDVKGTPTFAIVSSDGEEKKIRGAQPYSVFKSVIDSMI